jgi:anti-sigma B factor antagonist
MPLQMTERQTGVVTVLDLSGKLTIDDGAEFLKDKIKSLIFQQRTSVVLNLADVTYIDSGGLGELVASYSSLRKAGGTLKLLNISRRNHHLLSITRLVTVFDTFDSEDDAVRSFAQAIASPPAGVVSPAGLSHRPTRAE